MRDIPRGFYSKARCLRSNSSGAHQLCHQLCHPPLCQPLRQLPQPPFRHPPLRHQLPQASRCSPGLNLTPSPAISETAWRMAASRSATGERSAADNRESAGCCAASPGAEAPSSRDTPTAPAGIICESTLRYFCRNDIQATSDGTLSRRVSDETVTVVKPGKGSARSSARPRRRQIEYSGKNRAIRFMRSGQIPDAHQELVDDLPTGEAKGLTKQPRPFLRGPRVVGLEPTGERPVRLSQRLDAPRILGCRFDF